MHSFELVPREVVQGFALWQLVTYMFLHQNIGHILWNMLGLWMFGAQLERVWGTVKFLRFYFACGIFAGITVVVLSYMFGGVDVPTMGSSGAIYGILMAYGIIFADQTILFGFLIPMKAKYFVIIIGGIVFLQSFTATVGGQPNTVSVIAHLGGLVAGYLLLRGNRLQSQIRGPVLSTYNEWKLRRAKRKFEVYLRDKDRSPKDRSNKDHSGKDLSSKDRSSKDRWVH